MERDMHPEEVIKVIKVVSQIDPYTNSKAVSYQLTESLDK